MPESRRKRLKERTAETHFPARASRGTHRSRRGLALLDEARDESSDALLLRLDALEKRCDERFALIFHALEYLARKRRLRQPS